LFLLDQNEKIICTLGNETRPLLEDLDIEKLNQDHTFTFKVPGDIEFADEVKEGNFVLLKDLDGHWQQYEVIEVEEEHDAAFEIEAYCEHIYTELNDEIIRDKRPYNTTAELALMSILDGTRWQAGTVDSLGINSMNAYEVSVSEALSTLLSTWGGEVRFRVVVTGNQVTGRYVDVISRRGAITGKRIEYGKDIEQISRTVDMRNVKTALIGKGKGEEMETGGFGRRITFADINDGKDYIEDLDALARWGRLNPNGTRRHRWGIFEDSMEEDKALLKSKTEAALSRVTDPLISYEVDFIDLEMFGLDHERVRLGDTLIIIDREFKPELKLQARVIELRRSRTKKERGKIRLGNFLPAITDDKRISRIESIVNRNQGIWERGQEFDGPVPTSWLDGQIDVLLNQLIASGEYDNAEVIEGQGFLLENTKTGSPSYGALYLGPGIFAIASERDPVTDDWDWRTFGTGKGFTADLMNAGILKGGKVHLNLEEGTLLVGDSPEDYFLFWNGSNFSINVSKIDELNEIDAKAGEALDSSSFNTGTISTLESSLSIEAGRIDSVVTEIGSLQGEITELSTQISQTASGISIEIEQTLYGDGEEYSGFLGEIEEMMATRITAGIEGIGFNFEQASQDLDSLNVEVGKITNYFNFSAEGYLEIGTRGQVEGSEFMMRLDNQELGFYEGEDRIAWINNHEMEITKARIRDSLYVGNHFIEKFGDDITLIRWVGDE